jgi:hypothetical protein
LNQHLTSYLREIVLSELIDIVGEEDVTTDVADRFVYALDHYWIPEMWVDRARTDPA